MNKITENTKHYIENRGIIINHTLQSLLIKLLKYKVKY